MHTIVEGREGNGDGRHATARPIPTSPLVVVVVVIIKVTGRGALVALPPTRGLSSAVGDGECLELEKVETFIVQKSVGRNKADRRERGRGGH